MRRIKIEPRKDWRNIVELQGLVFHTTQNKPYWDESAYYSFSMDQVDEIEAATEELNEMCLKAVQHVIDNNLFEMFHIPEAAAPVIAKAWAAKPPSLYGRFDFAYDGKKPPKLLEYNADTPTSLFEAAIIQWDWLKDVLPNGDQFNSLHEKIVLQWSEIKPMLKGQALYFSHVDSDEDIITVSYLRACAHQAGIEPTSYLFMEEIGWNEEAREFRDLEENRISDMFKLYPWEWLLAEFSDQLLNVYFEMNWIEPIWKMILSNKAILAVLWEMFPYHPNLLKTQVGTSQGMTYYAKKPLLSREGANITIETPENRWHTGGDYGEEGYVYQAVAPVPDFGGKFPVLGSWYITGQGPAGMGIRESDGMITDNMSSFIPHAIE
jgi:glutathionylspermidine synthase